MVNNDTSTDARAQINGILERESDFLLLTRG